MQRAGATVGAISTGLEYRPLEPANSDIEAVVRRMSKVMCMTRRVPHDFLRHAADVDAGSAKWPIFNYADRCTVFSRSACVRDAATSTADNEKIKLIRQLLSPSSTFKNVC